MDEWEKIIANRYIVVYNYNSTDEGVAAHQASVMTEMRRRGLGARGSTGRDTVEQMQAFSIRGITIDAEDSDILEIKSSTEVRVYYVGVTYPIAYKVRSLMLRRTLLSNLQRCSSFEYAKRASSAAPCLYQTPPMLTFLRCTELPMRIKSKCSLEFAPLLLHHCQNRDFHSRTQLLVSKIHNADLFHPFRRQNAIRGMAQSFATNVISTSSTLREVL